MEVIKAVLFFFSLVASLTLIQDCIEKIIGHIKSKEDWTLKYISGKTETISVRLSLLTAVLWAILFGIMQY